MEENGTTNRVHSAMDTRAHIRSEVLSVTPDMARRWLDGGVKNRKIQRAIVKQIARDLRDGRWRLNGETIVISDEGHLIDGQHRLYACIDAAMPIMTLVVFGIPESHFDTMGTGIKRSLGQVLNINGEVNANRLSACLRHLTWWDKDHAAPLVEQLNHPVSNREGLATLARHDGIRRSVNSVSSVMSIGGISQFATCHYLACLYGERSRADEFISQVASGANLDEYDPAFQLRGRYMENKYQKVKKLSVSVIAALTVKAWNNYMLDRRAKILRYNPKLEVSFPPVEYALGDIPGGTLEAVRIAQ